MRTWSGRNWFESGSASSSRCPRAVGQGDARLADAVEVGGHDVAGMPEGLVLLCIGMQDALPPDPGARQRDDVDVLHRRRAALDRHGDLEAGRGALEVAGDGKRGRSSGHTDGAGAQRGRSSSARRTTQRAGRTTRAHNRDAAGFSGPPLAAIRPVPSDRPSGFAWAWGGRIGGRGGGRRGSRVGRADWTTVFNDDARRTAALLDRLTQRCHLLQFRGNSYRFRESLAARSSTEQSARPRPRRTATPPVAPTQTFRESQQGSKVHLTTVSTNCTSLNLSPSTMTTEPSPND